RVGIGSMTDGANGTILRAHWTTTTFNDLGQMTDKFEDTEQDRVVDQTDAADVGPALNLHTHADYHPTWGLIRTQFPNLREQRIVNSTGDGTLTQWVYNDVVFHNPGDSQTYDVLSPATIIETKG